MALKQNEELLLNLLLDQGDRMHFVDFIDSNKFFASICILVEMVKDHEKIKQGFFSRSETDFFDSYLDAYIRGCSLYQKIVGNTDRPVAIGEAIDENQGGLRWQKRTVESLERQSDNDNFLGLFGKGVEDCEAMIFSRNNMMFLAIRVADDKFIVIDPHINFCGLLDTNRMFRYLNLDGFWIFKTSIIYVVQDSLLVQEPIEELVQKSDQDSDSKKMGLGEFLDSLYSNSTELA